MPLGEEKRSTGLLAIYARQVSLLEPVIGHEAARLAVLGDKFPAGTLIASALIFLPAGWWAQSGGPQVAWAVAALGASIAVACLIVGIRMGRESARIASVHVSAQRGYPVRLKANGWRPSRWKADIDRQRKSEPT